MPSQDIKLSQLPNKYDDCRDTAVRDLLEIVEYIKCTPIAGVYTAVIQPNGDYKIWKSKTLGRLQQIGLLADMQHDLMHD